MTVLRLGLCCQFMQEPIRFRATTARTLALLPRREQLLRLSSLCLTNAASLFLAVQTVSRLGIGAFRVPSPIFPRATHPDIGYGLPELPEASEIAAVLEQVRRWCLSHDIRLSFHPDQFITLSSPRPEVTVNSVSELEHQAGVARLIGAEVINIHAGGGHGDKRATLMRLRENLLRLPSEVRKRLTLENDDVIYTVQDLLPVCRDFGIPLIYDVHHHRCNPDGLTVEEATELAMATWSCRSQEPWVHLSSPRNGWQGRDTRPHADYIDIRDFPSCWRSLSITVDVEAKAKELAVLKLLQELGEEGGYRG